MISNKSKRVRARGLAAKKGRMMSARSESCLKTEWDSSQSDQAHSGVVSSDWLKTHLELAEWINRRIASRGR